jgi:hypothetical protein
MEVADFLERYADLKTKAGHQRVVRHGHLPERAIMTGIGPVAEFLCREYPLFMVVYSREARRPAEQLLRSETKLLALQARGIGEQLFRQRPKAEAATMSFKIGRPTIILLMIQILTSQPFIARATPPLTFKIT